MSQRYEAVAVRTYEQNGEEKSAFTNIGVAWPMKDRDGFTLRLHCLPAPDRGEYTILLFPPKPKEDQQQRREPDRKQGDYRSQSDGGRSFNHDLDDEIPFAPEFR
ncbi:hypothetical protein ACTJJ7_20180 [Phyllobacterium sp. 22229]|uniref:hypothetical protein n=1 Tax=Phyllobacterium sp. 22229 TaxID=3453895 RepID=UPI003F85E1AA